MKKKLSRILSVLLAVLMVMSVMPLTAGAAEIIVNGTCGDNLIWKLDKDGVLTISGTGKMKSYGHISEVPWYDQKDSVKEIIINSGVTNIEDTVFCSMEELKYVSIPETVVEMANFNYCNPFVGCSVLEEIFVHSENPFFESVDGILYSKGMKSIRVYPAGKQDEIFNVPGNVTGIGAEAFYGCEKLREIYIPDSVTNIGGTVSSVYGVFAECKNLISVRLPEGLECITSNAFNGCVNLTTVNIPNSVKSILNGVFCDCEKLVSVDIPSGITSIGSQAFLRTGISTVNIHKNIAQIGTSAFGDCQKLIAIFVDRDNLNYSSADGVLYNKDKTALLQYPAGNTAVRFEIPEGVTEIKEDAFIGCDNLSDVKFPSTLTAIGNYAFIGCNGLTSVAIPDGITSLFGTFWKCENLKSVTIPKSITSLGIYAYTFGSDLTDVFYMGTEEEWKKIEGHDAWYFDRATIRYNSCPHSGIVIQPAVAPTCEEFGCTEGLICPVCGVLKEQTQIEAIGHHYNEEMWCNDCGEPLDCSCMCHQSGFMSFIWSIVRFFYMIFGINPVCECGKAHY